MSIPTPGKTPGAIQSESRTNPPGPVTRHSGERPEAQLRGRPENLGGPRLKLNVGFEIPGHKLQWTNDEDGGIERLLSEGFDFVLRSEVASSDKLKAFRSAVVEGRDVDDRFSKYVGARRDGSALMAYLMKCSEDTWDEREAQRQQQADNWDAQIRRGAPNKVDAGHSYDPVGYQSELSNGKVNSR